MSTHAPSSRSSSRPTWTVEVRPADGGEDAARFATELADAISSACERAGAAVSHRAPDARLTVLQVCGGGRRQVADLLELVAGVHKVQRIPPGASRRHTSTVTVAVLAGPPADDARRPTVSVPPDQVQVDYYRASGAGGQHRNKTESAVRLTHRPSGLVVTCAEQRSQHANLASAWDELQRRLADRQQARRHGRRNDRRVSQLSRDRRARRFVHNAQRDETVDHVTGRRWRMRRFLSGRIDR